MKKVVLSVALLSALAVSGAFAYGNGDCKMEGKNSQMKENCMQMHKKYDMKKHHMKSGHMKGFSLMRYLHKMDLSDEQRNEIRSFMKENRPQKSSMTEVFSKDGFDKDKYIQMHMNKKKNMLEYKANMMEKVYSVLTTEQKEKFLEDLKSFESKKAKGMMNDKYCNGRR